MHPEMEVVLEVLENGTHLADFVALNTTLSDFQMEIDSALNHMATVHAWERNVHVSFYYLDRGAWEIAHSLRVTLEKLNALVEAHTNFVDAFVKNAVDTGLHEGFDN